jgi:long-chain acyl-CoA synthetase
MTPHVTAHHKPWLSAYPSGVAHHIDTAQYPSLLSLLDESFTRYAERDAYQFLGQDFRFADIDVASRALAAYWQHLGLRKGDRVAIMLPNCPQYPVVVAAVLRAGLVVVNINPLFTARELSYQLQDSGAKAIVIMENFAHTLEQCIDATAVEHVVLCAMGDMLAWPRSAMVNTVVRHVKKLVPPFELPVCTRFSQALRMGQRLAYTRMALSPDDMAVLQYTGGTTGASKGAVLLHRNLIANMLQAEAWQQPALKRLGPGQQTVSVCALPLHHIFAFTTNMLLGLRVGGKNILIPNPRDVPALLNALKGRVFHNFPAVNSLFNALLNHPQFEQVNWRHLHVTIGGGMAVQGPVAKRWLERTGCPICEGYGLSETSPITSCNPVTAQAFNGTIGLPLPGTDMMCVDDNGQEVPTGEPGEIVIKGPQIMAGYWQQPDETAKAINSEGWFRTGDIGTMDAQGYFRVVDRKKDMIIISGFNVYPNEIEEVVMELDGVLECAAVGMPDTQSGEAVKLLVVRTDEFLQADTIRDYCRRRLTGYKQPKRIEFRDELPKTTVGKILRRELRDEAKAASPLT